MLVIYLKGHLTVLRMDELPVQCLTPFTWDIYPRVQYFRRRLIDLHTRFQRIIDAIPKVLHDASLLQEVQSVSQDFQTKTLQVMVIGRDNLTADNIFVSPPGKTQTEKPDFFSMIICYVTVDQLDRTGLENILQTLKQLKSVKLEDTERSFSFSLLVMCRTKSAYTQEENATFRHELFREIPQSLHCFLGNAANIIIAPDVIDLKHHISRMFETLIIEAFLKIRTFLNLFVLESSFSIQTKSELLRDSYVTTTITGFLQNGFGLSDLAQESHDRKLFLRHLIEKIAQIVKCVVIVPMSLKYTLPSWLCNRLLHEIKFEEDLVKSVSNDTHSHLSELHSFAIKFRSVVLDLKKGAVVLSSDITEAQKSTDFDFLLQDLLSDFQGATVKAEKTMSSMKVVRNLMFKMIFEIDGYLKQTIIQHGCIIQAESTSKIPEGLRHEIMSLKGVYGLGTIYGTCEIHLDDSDEEQTLELTQRIRSLMREHRFRNPYSIKYLKLNKPLSF